MNTTNTSSIYAISKVIKGVFRKRSFKFVTMSDISGNGVVNSCSIVKKFVNFLLDAHTVLKYEAINPVIDDRFGGLLVSEWHHVVYASKVKAAKQHILVQI